MTYLKGGVQRVREGCIGREASLSYGVEQPEGVLKYRGEAGHAEALEAVCRSWTCASSCARMTWGGGMTWAC